MKNTISGFLVFIGMSVACFAQKPTYNIKDFGAKGDGVTLCTNAINKAVTACSAAGGGVVVIPSGTFKSGTVFMKSNVELHLAPGSVLSASTDHKDFPGQPAAAYRALRDEGGWFAFLFAEGASNIAVTGTGVIDGNGALQKPRPSNNKEMDGRPKNIVFISCRQVRIEGIRMRNSAMWNQHYLDCEDVIIDKIEVYNHSNRNNDALDLDGCRRVTVSNSIFDSDDDGITLKSTGAAPAEDIVITNCIVSSFCNAIKAGTESTGGFRNISISNCVVKPSRSTTQPIFNTPRRGITGISLEIVDGGIMEGVTISNITIDGTECPLYIRLGNRARKHTESAPEPSVGKMRNISISDITAYNTGNFSSSITAIPGYYIENVNINNIQLFNKGGLKSGEYIAAHTGVKEDEKGYPQPTTWKNLPSSTLFVRHVKNLTVDNLMFGSDAPDPRIPIVAVDAKNLRIGKSTFSGPSNPESFIFLSDVDEHDIEKPTGWGNRQLIKK